MKPGLPPDIGCALFRQFAAATRHGLPLHEVAHILAQDPQAGARGRAAIAGLATALAEGDTLAGAMGRSPQAFATETTQWLGLAEQQGQLAAALDALASDHEQRERGRRAVRLALVWPLCLALGVAILFAVLAVFVMPEFSAVYASFGSELPALTRYTFAVAGYAAGGWWLWPPLLVLLVVGHATRRLPAGLSATIDAVPGRLGFVRRWRSARFVSRLLDMLRAHLAAADLQAAAMGHLAATATPPALAGVASRLQAALAGGSGLADALASEPLLPRQLALYAALGEKMHDLAAPMAQLCEAAEIEHRDALARLERGAVVLVYLLVGVTVGTFVIAVYLPIFRLGAVI
jgi:type IV pilus assembly protein PilC